MDMDPINEALSGPGQMETSNSHNALNMTPLQSYMFSDSVHCSELLKQMHQLKEQGTFCDVTLLVDREEISAHRVVLAGFSPYFAALFSPNMKEGQENRLNITLPALNACVAKSLINFAYTGEIEITADSVQDLLVAADFLHILSVRKTCADFIQTNIDKTNCFQILQFADNHGCDELKMAAKKYILRNFLQLYQEQGFLDAPVELVKEILENDFLVIEEESIIPHPSRQEEKLCDAVLWYTMHDLENRKAHVHELLNKLRLGFLSTDVRERLLKEVRNLTGSDDCAQIIEQSQVASNSSESENDVDNKWHKHRIASDIVIKYGPIYAGGGQVRPEIHSFDDEHADKWTYVKGMTVHIRRWDGHSVVGGLEVAYSDGTQSVHGEQQAELSHTFMLDSEERIVRVEVASGWMVDRIKFCTNRGRSFGPFGGTGGGDREADVPVDSLGFLSGVRGVVVQSQGLQAITKLQFKWGCHQWCLKKNSRPDSAQDRYWQFFDLFNRR